MPNLTVSEFMRQAFSVIGRDPSDVLLPDDQVPGDGVESFPDDGCLAIEGAVCNVSRIADYFLDLYLRHEWQLTLSERSSCGGTQTVRGFLSDSCALVVLIEDDDDAEFQRVNLYFPADSSPASQKNWLDQQKETWFQLELEQAASTLAHACLFMGAERAREVFDEILSDKLQSQAA
jgi:hypothetical protein